MKIKLLLPILAGLLTVSIQVKAENTHYRIINNKGMIIRAGYCAYDSETKTIGCGDKQLANNTSVDFDLQSEKLALLSIYWRLPENYNKVELNITNQPWRTFTINLNGSITGQ